MTPPSPDRTAPDDGPLGPRQDARAERKDNDMTTPTPAVDLDGAMARLSAHLSSHRSAPYADDLERVISALRASEARATTAEALADRLRQEAEIHAQEARTHKSSLHEAYQAVSGAKGEPGNWNGAEPIRAYVAKAEAVAKEQAETIGELVGALTEIDRLALVIESAVRISCNPDSQANYKAVLDALVVVRAFSRTRPSGSAWSKGKPPEVAGQYINVRSVTTFRWLPYKPDGARQMKKAGRWQQVRSEHGGWENAEFPEGAEWMPNDPITRPSGGDADGEQGQ